jgi:hypothetical protein
MKKIALLLLALMMMGTAQESMAQQRKSTAKKTAVKKTTTKAKSTSKPAAAAKPVGVSIPFDGPAKVDGKLSLFGISLAEKAAAMKTQLVSKGLKVNRNDGGGDDVTALIGTVEGVKTRVLIQETDGGKIYEVKLIDSKALPLAKAKTRFNSLVTKLGAIYGKGKYQRNEDEWKDYEFETGVILSLFNEDEMEGMGDYLIVITFPGAK